MNSMSAETNTLILATIGFGAPASGVFTDENEPRLRDPTPWPESISGAVTEGEHEYPVWQQDLYEVAPQLFGPQRSGGFP